MTGSTSGPLVEPGTKTEEHGLSFGAGAAVLGLELEEEAGLEGNVDFTTSENFFLINRGGELVEFNSSDKVGGLPDPCDKPKTEDGAEDGDEK